ncbi:MAG: hypothetical protein RPU72_07765, partial [Candidatus Sedimenticola sp. (ex Thyasira tokunagai)]
MTLRRFGCTPCMPYIAPCRSQFRPYNRAYAYRGLIASAFSLPWRSADEVNGQLGPNFKLSAETLLDDDQVRALDVKAIISPIIKPQDVLCLEALQTYIDLIPPEEISEDIENMYYFIVGKLN